MKKIFCLLACAIFSASALAAQAPADDGAKFQIVRQGNYVYFIEPAPLVLDTAQQAILKNRIEFVTKQLVKIDSQRSQTVDPDGDIAALDRALDAFSNEATQLGDVASKLYGEVKPYGLKYLGMQSVPTGLIIFGGIEYDKNFSRFFQGGGSIMAGLVLVPESITRINITNPQDRVTYPAFDYSVIFMPTANVGPGVSTSANGTNPRFGVGLIWGQLNKASDFVGLTGGFSTTLAVGAGLNVKLLGVDNPAISGAVNNMVLMVGVEKGQLNAAQTSLPLLQMSAESHLNLSYIMDANSILTTVHTGIHQGIHIIGLDEPTKN